jgi:tetratricopeptide (TPR) repeat protein
MEPDMKQIWLVLILAMCVVVWGSVGPTPAQQRELGVKDLQQAVQQEPNNPQVHYMLGLKYELDGAPERAMKSYQQAIGLKSDYPEALYRVGELKGAQGDQEGAIKALAKAIRLKPDYQEAKATLASVYGQQGATFLEQGRPEEAVRALKEAVALNAQDDAAQNNLGTAYVLQRDLDKAVEAFQAAIEANPGNVNAHYNLGSTYIQTGNKDGVLGQYAVLGNLDPAAAGQLFEELSFPKGKSMYAKDTPQHGTTMKMSPPSPLAVSPPPLPDPLRDAPTMQGPAHDSKMPPGQLR